MSQLQRRKRRINSDLDASAPRRKVSRQSLPQPHPSPTPDAASDDEDPDANLDAGHKAMQREHLAANIVRMALASELLRLPLKRPEVTLKALNGRSRDFAPTLPLAQELLSHVFGLNLTLLPLREKTSYAARRAAAARGATSTNSSSSYILTSLLPPAYRVAPALTHEAEYHGLVLFIVSLIYLNGRSLSAAKLTRYLRRMDADEITPFDTTENLLKDMNRQGYIVRVKDTQGEETTYEYQIGPRAKTEIGEEGCKEFIKTVYGEAAPKDLDAMFERTVGVAVEDMEIAGEEEDGGVKRKEKKKGRKRVEEDDDE